MGCRYLKDADSVWIVADIKRAVNNNMAKEMLGESFRRQLLMDGQYGQLAFVATQSDVLQRSEVARSLNLDPDSSKVECAKARNRFTKERLQDDYYEGLVEMARSAGELASVAEMRARHRPLDIFCVSAVDAQKLEGVRGFREDDPREVPMWADVAETEIPAMRDFIWDTTLRRRQVTMRRRAEAVVNFADSLHAFLDDSGAKDQNEREVIYAEFNRALSTALSPAMERASESFDACLREAFKGSIGPQLRSGANAATEDVMATVRGWGSSMHWATYKAHVRRHGEWRVDMNEQMAEPCYRAVSTYWERAFVGQLTKEFEGLGRQVDDAIKSFLAQIDSELRRAGMTTAAERVRALAGSAERATSAKCHAQVAAAKAHAQGKQRDVNRAITPAIKESMVPAYDLGYAEAGKGSAARRRGIIERHVDSKRADMFMQAIQPVLDGLDDLRRELAEVLDKAFKGAGQEMRVQLSALWDDADRPVLEARKRLVEKVDSVGREARGALNKLLESQGRAPMRAPRRQEDDDEIEDITDATAAATAQQRARTTVDVDLDAPGGGGGGGGGGWHAKPEVVIKPEVVA